MFLQRVLKELWYLIRCFKCFTNIITPLLQCDFFRCLRLFTQTICRWLYSLWHYNTNSATILKTLTFSWICSFLVSLQNAKCRLCSIFSWAFRGIHTVKEFKSWLHLVQPLHHIPSTKQQDRKHKMEKVLQRICSKTATERVTALITVLVTEAKLAGEMSMCLNKSL